ncbi:MAG: GNAT family protein [Bacteroidales bacterium]|nr:GNAT family protein [Bacteroidales bacterium]
MPSTIRLRALEPEDLDLLYLLENESDVWSMSAHTAPYSRHSLMKFIANTTYDVHVDGYVRLIAERVDGVIVGLVDLTGYDPIDLRAELGIAILPELRNKGYGRSAIFALLHYAKKHLGLRLVSATTLDSNVLAHKLLLSCGFEHAATLPKWYLREHKHQDSHIYIKFL